MPKRTCYYKGKRVEIVSFRAEDSRWKVQDENGRVHFVDLDDLIISDSAVTAEVK